MLNEKVKLIVIRNEVIDNIVDLTVERLDAWGIKDVNEHELAFSVNSTIEKVKNVTNQLAIPAGLTYTVVDMICGDFLQKRLDTGKLPEFNVEQAIKTLKIGDTSTTFQDGGKSGIDLLISSLIDGKGDLLSYRKLKW